MAYETSFFSLSELLVLLLAALVSNAAGSLACGLAGGLALAAATGLSGLLQITGLNSNNSFHCCISLSEIIIFK